MRRRMGFHYAILLRSGRGETKDHGEFRRPQNWLGGTRPAKAFYVPPPVIVQFETIHPFLDGNGRLGRLLIALFLVEENVLKEPLLYLSLYLKTHRKNYYRLLQEV